jgi:hypothetical protein
MADYTAKRIDDMEAIFLGGFKRARAELGVQSFGMQVIDMPPNLDRYPEHDHAESRDTIVRVGPKPTRKLWPGDEGLRVLALGGVPGQAYEAPDITQLGEPDPMVR